MINGADNARIEQRPLGRQRRLTPCVARIFGKLYTFIISNAYLLSERIGCCNCRNQKTQPKFVQSDIHTLSDMDKACTGRSVKSYRGATDNGTVTRCSHGLSCSLAPPLFAFRYLPDI